MSRTWKDRTDTPRRRNTALQAHLERRSTGAGSHSTDRKRAVAQGRSRKAKHPHQRGW